MMSTQKNITGLLSAILLTSYLAGCSAGDGGESSQPTDPKPYGEGKILGQLTANGQPLDISGLGIKTATVSGITQNGKFSYNSGEEIEFFLGGTQLGKNTAYEQLDLSLLLETDYSIPDNVSVLKSHLQSGISEFPYSSSQESLSGIHLLSNKIKLLLILDNDRDTSNGINLNDWNNKLDGESIDLNTSLYDNSAFIETFQNLSTPDLFTPVAIDVAEPLYYYHSVLSGKRVEVNTISSIIVPGSLKREITFEYDNFGRFSKTLIEDKDNSTNQARHVSDTSFNYGKYGEAIETSKLERENIASEESTSRFERTSIEYNGYYDKTGTKVLAIKETTLAGKTESEAVIEESTEQIIHPNIPYLVNERNYRSYNDDRSSSVGSYSSEFDNEGRLTSSTSKVSNYNPAGELEETNYRHQETLTYSTNQNELVKTRKIDQADQNGDFDGQPEETQTTSVLLDDKKRVDVCTTNSYDNTQNEPKQGYKYQYSYVNDGPTIDGFTYFRDMNADGTYGGAGQETEQWGGLENTRNQQGVITQQISTLNSNQKKRFDYIFLTEGENSGKIGNITISRNQIYQDNFDYLYGNGQLSKIIQRTFRTDTDPKTKLSELVSNFEYEESGDIKRNLIQKVTASQTIDKTITRETMSDGIGYIVRQQDKATLNEFLEEDSDSDYRLRANIPGAPTVSSSCIF